MFNVLFRYEVAEFVRFLFQLISRAEKSSIMFLENSVSGKKTHMKNAGVALS